MKITLIVLVTLVLASCGKKSDKSYFAKTTVNDFSSIINKRSSSQTPEDFKVITVEDKSYYRGKIELSLYSDETFSFKFADYSEDTGNWRFEDNSIQLEGSLGWINLEMFLFKKSPNSSKYFLQFIDAQGTKVRDLEKKESL
jgi:hypothetical protein